MTDQFWEDQILAMLNADTEDFLELAKIAGLDIRHDFSGSDLSGTNMINADFTDCDFSNADFSNANLRNTNFTRANLRNVSFIGTDLTGANLTEADLRESDFFDAKIKNTVFQGANTIGVTNLNLQDIDRLSDVSGFTTSNEIKLLKKQVKAKRRQLRRLRLKTGMWEAVIPLIRFATMTFVVITEIGGFIYDLLKTLQFRRISRFADLRAHSESLVSKIRSEQLAEGVRSHEESQESDSN